MSTPDAIGGYFELEPPRGPEGDSYHRGPDFVNARSALAHVIEARDIETLYVPYYICDSVLEGVLAAGASYRWYGLDETLAPVLPEAAAEEWVLCVNYFGTRPALGRSKVITDATQDFYYRSQGEPAIYSARKWFGVPDGAYLDGCDLRGAERERTRQPALEHLVLRSLGDVSGGYALYQTAEAGMGVSDKRMSRVSDALLRRVDYEAVAGARRANFAAYAEVLDAHNVLRMGRPEGVPFCYPLLPEGAIDRDALFAQRVYPSRLWPEVVTRGAEGFERETALAERLAALPVDHRYSPDDCTRAALLALDALEYHG